jgi:hypothetical protein
MARARIEEDRLDLVTEYMNWPSEEMAMELDGLVDPGLRVGNFHPRELKWAGNVPISVA